MARTISCKSRGDPRRGAVMDATAPWVAVYWALGSSCMMPKTLPSVSLQ